jgi:hypothetical protein
VVNVCGFGVLIAVAASPFCMDVRYSPAGIVAIWPMPLSGKRTMIERSGEPIIFGRN